MKLGEHVTPKRILLAGTLAGALFVGSCSVFVVNTSHKINPTDEEISRAVHTASSSQTSPASPTSTVTVYTPSPVPSSTATVIQRVVEQTDACRDAGVIAEQVTSAAAEYTKQVGPYLRAMNEGTQGVAMRDLGKISRAESKMNEADNLSTAAGQRLVELTRDLKAANQACKASR